MFGRLKQRTGSCWSCERPIRADVKVCRCGSAMPTMTFDERRRYEVERYRAVRERARTA